MSLLAQQELLEVPPSKRLIVPHGHCAWWGVDPSSVRVAIAGVLSPPDGGVDRWVEVQPFAPVDGPQRLSEVYAVTRALTERLARGRPWPGLVLIEQPSGSKQSVNLPLIYAVGCIQAAIWDGLFSVCGRAVQMQSVTSSWWKARAVGRGNVYKPKREKGQPAPTPEAYEVLRWARLNGYEGSSWDAADAWGIAEAGRREYALEVR